jgi:hypothetical protein
VDNAARHTRTSVDVSVTVSGGESRIQVDDDGDGLSPEDCDRVFDRCVRLDESRDRNEEGTSPSPCETRPRPSPRPDCLFACWHAEGGCGLAESQHNAPPQSNDATSSMCPMEWAAQCSLNPACRPQHIAHISVPVSLLERSRQSRLAL